MFAGDPCPKCGSKDTVHSMQQNVKWLPDLSDPQGGSYVVFGRRETLKCEKCGHEEIQQWGRP